MTDNILSSFKDNTGKKTVIEDSEDDIGELPDSKTFKDTVRVFY